MKRMLMMFLIGLILLPVVSAGASDLGGMRFSLVRGDVQVKTEDTDDWVPASINTPLREGDRIWVPDEGTAEIQTRDGSYLRLAERTALEVLSLEKDSYQTFLAGGRLYVNLRGGRDSFLQVDTPSSSVRAYERAKFNVDAPETAPVRVSVFQGEAAVENREGSIRVASGESLTLGEGADSEKSSLGSPDDWERWNYERDSKMAERRPPSRHLPEELQPYSGDFYDNGRWVHTPDYGYVWTPTVSVTVGWAPYRHGRWVWIGGDYVWVSYEPWGWAPYHYGRWYFAASIGWCWVPPARGAVYWGPGYVGWVYTDRHVAWVPLAPREVYYGHGHHGPHSVNITNVNVTNVHVDKVVYRNVRVNNAVTTVDHDTFVRGRPADSRVKENPFLKEKVHPGRPSIRPEKASVMPVVREVPEAKRPPERVRQANVRELKKDRPMVKSREASVFAPETRPREMPVKEGEARPSETRTERSRELRQPGRTPEEPRVSGPAEKRGSRPAPSEARDEGRPTADRRPDPRGSQQEPEKPDKTLERTRQPEPAPARVQEQRQQAPSDKGRGRTGSEQPAVVTPKEKGTPEKGIERSRERRPEGAQEQKQGRPSDTRSSQPVPSEPAVKTPKQSQPTVRGGEPPAPAGSPSVAPQDRGQGRSSNRGGQPIPSEPAARTPQTMKTPDRGQDRKMESRPPERVMEQNRPPERVQPKSKEVVPPEKGMQQVPEVKTPEKRTEGRRGPRNQERGG